MSEVPTSSIDPWLQVLWDAGGTDLLLSGGSAPRIRVIGQLRPLENAQALTGDQIKEIAVALLTPNQREIFEEMLDVDFSFSWGDKARIRGSAFTQRGQTALALRVIPTKIPSFEELGFHGRRMGSGAASRIRARNRTYWFGKVDLARLDRQSNQREASVSHFDDRGPGRVRAHAQDRRR